MAGRGRGLGRGRGVIKIQDEPPLSEEETQRLLKGLNFRLDKSNVSK